MPKKPPRDNPRNRTSRTIQGAAEGMAGLLQRIGRRSDVILSAADGSNAGASHISGTSMIELVRAALPETLRPHVQNCLLRTGELVLFADAAVWATRIRLAACETAASGGFAALPGATTAPRITVRVAGRAR